MNGLLKKNKYSKLIWLGIGVLLLAIVAAVFLFYSHKSQSTETVTVYYQQKNDAGMDVTKTAILDEENARKIQGFLDELKYREDVNDSLPDINRQPYEIRGEHKGSSTLDFNYNIYKRKNHYIVMNTSSGKFALAEHNNYNFLELFLSEGNLGSFQAGPAFP